MIPFINRETGQIEKEPVWGYSAIKALYHVHPYFFWLQALVARLLAIPFVSVLWGVFHDTSWSKRRIRPFCQEFHINMAECTTAIDQFTSFNDFFTRKLKESARPLNPEAGSVLVPADARYTFFENVQKDTSVDVKGKEWNVSQLLGSSELASRFYGGTLVLARLCPLDCHRFYFPVAGVADRSRLVKGPLYSVNPLATKERPWIFWTNKRVVTLVKTESGSSCAMVEIGATNCGSIHQTYVPGPVHKGQEKGYFKLGGSSIVLLFEPGCFQLASDLKQKSQELEIYCKIGQKLGTIL